MLGFGGLSVGYFLPVGEKIGAAVGKKLPSADYRASNYLLPGIALLLIGMINSVLATAVGLFGFQKAEEINSYDGLIFLTTLFWLEASFLLWYVLFRQKTWNFTSILVIAALVGTAISKALLAGNRGSAIQIFSIIVLAYVLSGRELKFKQASIAGVLLIIFLILGMIYGTTFREVKGSESTQSFDRYTENIFSTFEQVGRNDNVSLLQYAFSTLAERIDGVSSLAVVTSNYEKLAPYEASYDLDNNIWKDTTTFFIPRVIWPDKPVASEPRRYSELYFNYGESSFTITPMGDLLRNFGIWGVPLGMLLLGVLLRVMYRSLVERQPKIVWRSALYFMLLTAINYETFYGSIIPYLFKYGMTAVVGVILVNVAARQIGNRNFVHS
jgi:oligosaccharide repeat unit polymerase